MRILRSLLVIVSFTVMEFTLTAVSTAQVPASAPSTAITTVEVTPATSEISMGQKVKFNAVAKDSSGNVVKSTATAWFAAPFDLAGADESGTVSFFAPGEVLVGAIVDRSSLS